LGPVVSGPVCVGDGLDDVAVDVVGRVGVGLGFGSSLEPPVQAVANPTIRAIASNRVGTPKMMTLRRASGHLEPPDCG